nr:immunoglobulin heavy chain junction region [Macaca mulatta]MOW23388.1 immunoglobulin heavy chain junction region [Macaca mulatta]MOW23453.1 immunoglobulin heavy chain junction region [Macaca mulatta]MOW25683.1 immunoglobulin heavy chain junction region [Macaca mulatta]MOW26422.1 immunoglobulin heavy chain junction region [Macaca mulatta]
CARVGAATSFPFDYW